MRVNVIIYIITSDRAHNIFLFSNLMKIKNHSLRGLTWQVFSYHHLLLMILWLKTKVMTFPWVTIRRICVIIEQDFLEEKKSMMHIYELCTFRCLKKIIRSTQYYPAQLPHGIFILNNKTLTCYFLKIRIHFLTKVIMGWTLYDLFSGHMHRNRCWGPWGSCPFVTEAERVSRDLPEIRAGTVMYYVSLWHQDGVYWTHCYHLMLLIDALLDVICN